MNTDNDKQKALEELTKISEEFQKFQEEREADEEEYWNSLSKEDQLKCFCAVARRIYKGEIEEKGTYRYVLYNVFGFGPESYVSAQLSGYLSIHNAIFTGNDLQPILINFAQKMFSASEKDAIKKADKFIFDSQY